MERFELQELYIHIVKHLQFVTNGYFYHILTEQNSEAHNRETRSGNQCRGIPDVLSKTISPTDHFPD